MAPHLGSIPAYAIGWSLALLLGGGAAVWLLQRAGMDERSIAWTIVPRVLALFLGSKLLYLAEAWPQLTMAGLPAAIFSPQMRLPGGVILVVVVGVLLSRWNKVPYLWLADTIAPAGGLVIFGIRIGCLLEGCCHGTPTSLPWGMRFGDPSSAFLWHLGQGTIPAGQIVTPALHPLQIYFALVGLALFVALTLYAPHKRYAGEVPLLFGLGYLWSTWLLEFLRGESHTFTQQFVWLGAVGCTLLAAAIEARRAWVARQKRPARPPPA